eukprot:TRINITY_DN48691_c0_g1_i1.p1 TRINITY_DN48691_c0_g1~~TRINITY_DN48691_c0_g1_i1.p1  ORF type:complete len:320 (+),score=94.63 TRINITY_DN48691_c0_g1_i1:58-1017(+)
MRRSVRFCALPAQRRFVLVDHSALSDAPAHGTVVVDCSKQASAYARAHIPGSVHLAVPDVALSAGSADANGVPVGQCYARRPVPGVFVKNPDDPTALATADQVQEMAARLGISAGCRVIAYDDNNSLYAARLWWVLTVHGFADCSVLDGGWRAWCEAGRRVEVRPPPAQQCWGQSPVVLDGSGSQRVAQAADAAAAAAAGQLWDTRTLEQWTGDDAQGNARGGRIEGAKHLNWLDCVDHETARIKTRPELERLFEAAGIDPEKPCTTVCQMGIRAAFAVFVLEARFGNRDTRVYDRSMADWNNRRLPEGDFALPAACGA